MYIYPWVQDHQNLHGSLGVQELLEDLECLVHLHHLQR